MIETKCAESLSCMASSVPKALVQRLDTEPRAIRESITRSEFPGLRCEQVSYVVRVSVDGLPSHAFSTRHCDWVWLQPRERRGKAEATEWPRHEPPPLTTRQVEVIRRGQRPLSRARTPSPTKMRLAAVQS